MKRLPLFLLLIFLIASCRSNNKYGEYAIRDFRTSLQPHLKNIVTEGLAGYDSSSRFIRQNASTTELEHLANCEHPVLRAVALRAILDRKNVDLFGILMSHLDDTAHIHCNYGEWGIGFTTVADDLIENFEWQTEEDKQKTIEEVITKHPYLDAAYTILPQVKPEAKYYPFIKRLATQEKFLIFREKALYALARYKKKEDLPFIRDQLLHQVGVMGEYSFKLIKEYPDSSYLDVLYRYKRSSFWDRICLDRSVDNAGYFFQALASYKDKRSEDILAALLHRKGPLPCYADTFSLKRDLCFAIWDNACPAYAELVEEVKPYIEEVKKGQFELPLDPYTPPPGKPPIRWLEY